MPFLTRPADRVAAAFVAAARPTRSTSNPAGRASRRGPRTGRRDVGPAGTTNLARDPTGVAASWRHALPSPAVSSGPDVRIVVPPPGAHGGDGAAIAEALGVGPEEILDLSASLNPLAPDVSDLVRRHSTAATRYPDPRDATGALAAAMGIDPGRLLLTNGGSEAIALVAAELGGRVLAEPEFSLHPRGSTGPTWRSDPHSPSGVLASAAEAGAADVWDEAYFPLATGRWTAGRPGTTVGSLTKVFACPGLRLGYVLDDDVERFAARQPAWPVGTVALAVLVDLLEVADLPRWRDGIAALRADLVALLAEHHLVADAADAPWVLVAGPGLRERLAPHGVVVRDCTSFGLPDHVRIAVPDEPGLARLAAALEATTP